MRTHRPILRVPSPRPLLSPTQLAAAATHRLHSRCRFAGRSRPRTRRAQCCCAAQRRCGARPPPQFPRVLPDAVSLRLRLRCGCACLHLLSSGRAAPATAAQTAVAPAAEGTCTAPPLRPRHHAPCFFPPPTQAAAAAAPTAFTAAAAAAPQAAVAAPAPTTADVRTATPATHAHLLPTLLSTTTPAAATARAAITATACVAPPPPPLGVDFTLTLNLTLTYTLRLRRRRKKTFELLPLLCATCTRNFRPKGAIGRRWTS